MGTITGKDLINWGFKPGPWFGSAIKRANELLTLGYSIAYIEDKIRTLEPEPIPEIPYRTNSIPFTNYLAPQNDEERRNYDQVVAAMDSLMRTPTIVSGEVMPDACPAGVIPVGGVVATKDAIHPGFHSADVCCSMAITVFKREMDLKSLLDAAHRVTHFGPGGRTDAITRLGNDLAHRIHNNRFLGKDLLDTAQYHLGTQGDGNHFLFVGTLRSTGQPAIVTHHGSRGLGATLYRRGMAVAKRHTAIHSPRTPAAAAWIDANSDEGRDYWEALQIVRDWTKLNHWSIHDAIQQAIGNRIEDRFWNEHNFVFRRDDGLFYHAKGATPSFNGFSPDDDGRTLIPMNMSEPILITRHTGGFAPHGAGRNMSRTEFLRNYEGGDDIGHLDVRFYLGKPDFSELPSAYKKADHVINSIRKHNLADIVDYVDPYGCIMAGTHA